MELKRLISLSNASPEAIATKLNIDIASARDARAQARRQAIYELSEQGLSQVDIAMQVGMHQTTVSQVIRSLGKRSNRLSEDEASARLEAIKELAKSDLTQVEIARKLGITQPVVSIAFRMLGIERTRVKKASLAERVDAMVEKHERMREEKEAEDREAARRRFAALSHEEIDEMNAQITAEIEQKEAADEARDKRQQARLAEIRKMVKKLPYE
jgi:predicted transcriptional regulator